MTLDTKKNSGIMLMTTIKNAECLEQDCAICYKKINKKYFECSAPCGKVFHTSCIEKMMEQIEETANETDEDANFRCCYCRRDIDVDNYMLQLFANHLITLDKTSYDVRDAMKRVAFLMKTNEKPDEDESFDYYQLIRYVNYMKKPKQPKRQILKKQLHSPRQFRVKQNIGGRRR